LSDDFLAFFPVFLIGQQASRVEAGYFRQSDCG